MNARAESHRTFNVGVLLALCWCTTVWASLAYVAYLIAK